MTPYEIAGNVAKDVITTGKGNYINNINIDEFTVVKLILADYSIVYCGNGEWERITLSED
jgi:hypothetical protein